MKPRAVVGIDPSSAKLAMVTNYLPFGEFEAFKVKLDKDHWLGCQQAHDTLLIHLATMQSEGWDPFVVLEAPVMGVGGVWPTIVQSQIGGALMAAISKREVKHRLCSNTTWKKRILGRGNIPKPEIAGKMSEVWPELVEEAGKDQDLIDAGAINLYGWHVLGLKDKLSRGKR